MKQAILLFCIMFFCTSTAFSGQGRLDLKSQAVMVLDIENNHIIYDKNSDEILPIASITKLMTAMVILDANLPFHEKITIDAADVDKLKNTTSRLVIGTSYPRYELLRLALMSSENRAASALGRTYPGGIQAFVNAMNKKALALKMLSSHFVEATGLSSHNVSTARDLAKLVIASNDYETIRNFSTTSQHKVSPENKKHQLQFVNSNSLVRSESWEIDVSKTGYLHEAGRCLVMQANITGKSIAIILLNSTGKNTRIADANRVKKWMESNQYRKQV